MHKWGQFEKFFVYIEISPTSLVLELNFQKNMFRKMRLVRLVWIRQKNIWIAGIYA